MKNHLVADCLRFHGFNDGDVKGDLNIPLRGFVYLTRVYEGQFQYVSLCEYDGEFLEAPTHIYAEKYNSRAKQNQSPLHGTIYRDVDELVAAVNKVYPLPKKA